MRQTFPLITHAVSAVVLFTGSLPGGSGYAHGVIQNRKEIKMAKVEYPPEIQRKLKRILKPVLSVLRGRQYKPCDLCGTETSWTVNNRPVCPQCSVKYGFVKESVLPDACEVCGRQGEWCCGKDDQHSLCCRHRDAWFDWTKEPFLPRGYDKLPEDQKDIEWEKAFATFIQEMKGA